MTNQTPSWEAAPTAEQWDREMERLVGSLRPGRNVQDFTAWQTEVRRQYGHHPYSRLRRAVNLTLTQVDEIPAPQMFGIFLREAERQLAEEAGANNDAPRLTVDEERQQAERNETYRQIYLRVGIGTEPFEWNLCRGIAKGRYRTQAPTDEQVEDIYQKRRAMGITVGRWEQVKHFPSWNKEHEDKDDFWTPNPPA